MVENNTTDPLAAQWQREAEAVRRLETEVARLREREAAIVRALGVCDGGRYINDILGKIEMLKARAASHE